MNLLHPSRRQVMGASLVGGIAVYLAPLGSRAFAALFEEQLLTRPAWNDGVLNIASTVRRRSRERNYSRGTSAPATCRIGRSSSRMRWCCG